MGKPVNVMPQMANLASNGDIVYGNFGTYVVAEKNGLNLAISRDFKFDTDEIAYRVTVRQSGCASIPSQTNVDTSVQAAFSARF
jgi:HK97 family phage major capsid protein